MKTETFPADYEIANEDKHKYPLTWIDRSCDGDGWYAELSGIALELIRLHAMAEIVQTGQYSVQKRRRDFRSVMSSLNWKPGGSLRFPGVETDPHDRAPLAVPDLHDCLIIQQDPEPVIVPEPEVDAGEEEEDSPDLYGELSPSVLESVGARCTERMAMFETIGKETYEEGIATMEQHHQDLLEPEFLNWRMQTLAKAIIPPVLLEPALKTTTSEQWAQANAWERELMCAASTEECIRALEAQIVTLAVMKDDLVKQRDEARERKRKEDLRRQKLEEIFGEKEAIRAEIATLNREVEESVEETKYVGPKMEPGMLNTFRAKKDALVRRGGEAQITADVLEGLRLRKAVQAGSSQTVHAAPSKTVHEAPSKIVYAAPSKRPSGSMRGSEPASSQRDEFLHSEQDSGYTLEETDMDQAMADAEAEVVPMQPSSPPDAGNE